MAVLSACVALAVKMTRSGWLLPKRSATAMRHVSAVRAAARSPSAVPRLELPSAVIAVATASTTHGGLTSDVAAQLRYITAFTFLSLQPSHRSRDLSASSRAQLRTSRRALNVPSARAQDCPSTG